MSLSGLNFLRFIIRSRAASLGAACSFLLNTLRKSARSLCQSFAGSCTRMR
jgi:hypothetical protein